MLNQSQIKTPPAHLIQNTPISVDNNFCTLGCAGVAHATPYTPFPSFSEKFGHIEPYLTYLPIRIFNDQSIIRATSIF